MWEKWRAFSYVDENGLIEKKNFLKQEKSARTATVMSLRKQEEMEFR